MILTCPECSTKYMAKHGMIGPNGRSVSCARCDAVWHVEGTDPDVLALEDNKAALVMPEPEPKPDEALDIKTDLKVDTRSDLPFTSSQSVAPTIGAHTLLRDKADAEKLSKRKRLIRLIWAAPLLILIGAAAAVVMKRQTLVENYPKTATFFQAIGLNVKSNGLDLRELSSERIVIDGNMILRVSGDVVNLTAIAKTSPLVQFRLENRSGEALADWFVEPGTIPASESVRIETDYPDPPIDGVELRYRFVPDE